jgi:hypothetical protein
MKYRGIPQEIPHFVRDDSYDERKYPALVCHEVVFVVLRSSKQSDPPATSWNTRAARGSGSGKLQPFLKRGESHEAQKGAAGKKGRISS